MLKGATILRLLTWVLNKLYLGLFGGLVVNIESEGHKVQLNSSLGGGLRLNVNQKDSNSHEDLHKIKTEVDHCQID